jgi:hypothetical protein
MHLADVVRAKVLHWHKATFFPDFMPACGRDDDDIGSEGENEAEEGEDEEEEPSTARRMVYGASTALVHALLCSARNLLNLLTSTRPALLGRSTGVCGRVQFGCGPDVPSGNRTRALSFFYHTTTRHDTTRHDTTRHDTTRHDTTRHDTTRHTPYLPYHAQITMYMTAQPHVYGPLGTLGARLLSPVMSLVAHEADGCWC